MTAVSTVGPTGNSYIDGVLTGTKWAVNSLTFSFPQSASLYGSNYGNGEPLNNFEAFTSVQQTAVRSALQNFSSVANLQFTELAETTTQSATIRYSESDSTSTAWGYYPNPSAAGGDMWFNNSKNYYDNPAKGNYAYEIILHETGHALGLKHPHESFGSFGALPLDRDSVEYTVMSYRSYVGGPLSYTMANGNYPQTLMMYDIAALQTMYGANFTTNSGNTVYRWDPSTGQEFVNGTGQGAPMANKIFMTLWDGGGNDTYDFSNYATNLKIDLSPGGWTTVSTSQLANLGNGHYAAGNIANALLFQGNTASLIENAIGGAGADVIAGNQGDNKLTGGAGNDILDGKAGTDTAVFTGISTNYIWNLNLDGSWLVTDLRLSASDGIDTLKNIESLQFSDKLVSLVGTTSTTTTTGTGSTSTGSSATTAVNTAPAITSAPVSLSVYEWADGSPDETINKSHNFSGTIVFSDVNLTDTHTASFTAKGTGYLGTFALASVNQTYDKVSWSFKVPDSVMDYLNSGQSLTQLYDVTINDGHGGTAIQTATITLRGRDDVATTTTTTSGSGKGKKGAGPSESIFDDQAPGPADSFTFNSSVQQQDVVDLASHHGFLGVLVADIQLDSGHAGTAVDHLPDLMIPDVAVHFGPQGQGGDWTF